MLEGDISEIRLVERLVELWREQFTGAIRFENDGIIKIVYFKGGDILSASTNDRADSIDEILMKAGKVSREHVKQALAKRKESETLGDALLNLGFITRKELTWARRVQVVGVIRSIAAWTTGSFTIVADYLPKRDEGTLFPLPQVLVELIVTEQDRQQFERSMEGGAAVFAKAPDFDTVFRALGLNEDAEAIAAEIDGTQSASGIATVSGRDAFNTYKLLHALATLGIIRRAEKPREEHQFSLDDFASAGVSDAAHLWNEQSAAPAPVPVVSEGPMFQLDEAEALRQPTLEMQIEPIEFQTEAEPAARPPASPTSWDETEETPAPAPPSPPPPQPVPVAAPPEMPAWETPPAVAPRPTRVETPAQKAEERLGFDEAQLETARRASAPVAAKSAPKPMAAPKPKGGQPVRPRKRGPLGLIIVLLVVAVLGAGGYYGWMWWQGREATPAAPAPAVSTPAPRPAPAPTATAVSSETEPTAAVAETTTTVAPPPAVPSKAPVPETTTRAAATTAPAPPPIAPVSGSRARYDQLAREYAASPAGNFTIQISILCDPSNLGKVISQGGPNVWFVPQPVGARSCYRVFWGRFASREEADRGMAGVPAALRDRSAAVKPVPR